MKNAVSIHAMDYDMLQQILLERSLLSLLQVVKLDNRCLLYSAGDAPAAFFDAEGRSEPWPQRLQQVSALRMSQAK